MEMLNFMGIEGKYFTICTLGQIDVVIHES